ncbi:beta-propeller fold lactonase family protein [Mycolicibacterium anyangense]|nr:beta-propeller fold lactonase family protein [Mycolicibacterium anyangense]
MAVHRSAAVVLMGLGAMVLSGPAVAAADSSDGPSSGASGQTGAHRQASDSSSSAPGASANATATGSGARRSAVAAQLPQSRRAPSTGVSARAAIVRPAVEKPSATSAADAPVADVAPVTAAAALPTVARSALAVPKATAIINAGNTIAEPVTQYVSAVSPLAGIDATDLPGAPSPTPLLAGLWESVRRQFQRTFLNQTPTAAPRQLAATPQGLVVGTLGANDYDGDPLQYAVTQNPLRGTVTVGQDGTYTYQAAATLAASGGTDDFTVAVSDVTQGLHLFDGNGTRVVHVVVTVPDPAAQSAQIAVGDTPSALAVSPDGKRLYVANLGDNSLSVVDTSTNTTIATVGVGSNPVALALSPTAGRAYVVNSGGDSVSVIDTQTNTVLLTTQVGDSPTAIALNPGGSRAYVVNSGSGTVSVIDTSTNFVVGTIAVGQAPSAIAMTSDGRAFVTNYLDKTASVIDTATNRVVFTIGLNASPSALALSPDGTSVYVTDLFRNAVSVIDTKTGATTVITVGANPDAVALSDNGARAYVVNSADNTVSVIDTVSRSVIDTITVGNTPDAVALNPVGAVVYVANSNDNTVSAIPVVTDGRAPSPGQSTLLGSTRGFDVYNLTSKPLTLVDYYGENRPQGNVPAIGSVVQPGQAMHFEVVYRFLITNNIVYPVFSGPDDARYVVGLQAGPFGGPGTGCNVVGGAGQQCSPTPNGPDLIAGNTVKLLDKPGTTVEFGPGQAQDQAKVLNSLCYQDSKATCTFKADRQIDTFGLEKAIVNDLVNESRTEVLVRALALSDTRSESDSVKVTAKLSRSFLEKIVNLEISAEYGHTWTYTHTFTETITIRQPPRTIGGVQAQQAVYRVYGDFTLKMGNTTFTLRDVYFDTPNPNITGRYRVTEEPLDTPADGVAV